MGNRCWGNFTSPPDYPCPMANRPHRQGVPFAKIWCLWDDNFMIQAISSAPFSGEGLAFRAGGLLLLAL